MVLCGGSQMRQVLVNLMGNSIHYGKPEGSTHVALSIKDQFVEVVIEDDGIGISEEDQARIYERFYRVDRSRSRNSGGSGLGLAIVKHILEAHGQEIQVASKIGEGTRFSFQLQRIPAVAIA
jgi:two-component system phosphate regulon sensor histidine kinase PhoR